MGFDDGVLYGSAQC